MGFVQGSLPTGRGSSAPLALGKRKPYFYLTLITLRNPRISLTTVGTSSLQMYHLWGGQNRERHLRAKWGGTCPVSGT